MISNWLANAFILLGALYIIIAAVGLLRLPGIYLKLHAATKVGTIGCGLMLSGVGIKFADMHALTEIILLIFFITLTNPISAHLLGRLQYQHDQSRQSDTLE